jgi:hypothetical protein
VISKSDFREELSVLVTLYVAGMANDEQFERLEHLLATSQEARSYYLDSLNLHAGLAWRGRRQQEALEAEQEAWLSFLTEESARTSPPPPPPPPPPLTYTFVEEPSIYDAGDQAMARWRLATRVMTVAFSIALVAGLLQSYFYPAPAGRDPTAASPATVGAVTNLVDCQWPSERQKLGLFDRVAVGQTCHLEAGLLEITYDTGFQVILQGRVSYEITTGKSGFLSAGKLSGKASTERARGFVVDMPGARITDLGTEFGAEVASDGTVETVVFSGKIELAPTTPGGGVGRGQVLHQGEAAQVASSSPTREVRMVKVNPADRFTRAMRPVPAQVLIGPDQLNGSFEEPVLGPDDSDTEASNPAEQTFVKTQNAVPRFWNRTYAMRTKGNTLRGVTGQQCVMLQGASSLLSTQFDGRGTHPPKLAYEPHTIYVLTADIGGNMPGVQAWVALDDGVRSVNQTVSVSEPNVLAPMPAVIINTDKQPEFVGKPISVIFMNKGGTRLSQLFVDNVVLRAISPKP